MWDANLINIKYELAGLFEDEDSIRAIVRDSDIPLGFVKFNGKAINCWSDILQEAIHRNKLANVIRAALTAYPGNLVLQNAEKVFVVQAVSEIGNNPFPASSTVQRDYAQYEQELHEALQEARLKAGQSIVSLPSPYKIDKSFFIRYNLDAQRSKFLDLLKNKYKGAFAFAVTCHADDILREYILERLLLELRERNGRDLICYEVVLKHSDLRGGEQCIERKILSSLQLDRLTDLFIDNAQADIVIKIWHDTCLTKLVRIPALSFWEKCLEQVQNFLLQQNRCLVLFWVTIKDQPLNRNIALPALEEFEIDELTSWLEVRLRAELKAQGAEDSLIDGYLDTIKHEIVKWEGHLIKTYEIIKKLA